MIADRILMFTTLQPRSGNMIQEQQIQFSDIQISKDTETTAFINNKLNESSLLDETEAENNNAMPKTNDVKSLNCF